ncbi:MAG: hypothetical protein JNM60_01020 [Candidatus Competibacteraceae bacterium]|nr:hypothetical protein [Candidatus Competibacteraceae bacterium]
MSNVRPNAALPAPGISNSGVGVGAGSAGARPALPAPGQRQPAELLPYLPAPAPYSQKYDRPFASLGGGFVGASTDAQADRAMQDRAAQSAAAQQNIASMNAAADAMRGLRAAKLGVSAGVLDRMEGRNDTAAAAADSAAQGAIPAHWNSNPFSLPGDGFQDTRGRQAEYGRLLDQAASGGRGQRQGAMIGLQGLGGLMESNQKTALGLEQVGATRDAADAGRYAAMLRQQSDQERNQQRFGLDARRFNLDVSRLNRDVANDQRKAQQQQPTSDQVKANLAAQIMAAHYNKDPAKLKELEERYWKLGFARQPEQMAGLPAPP